ncbi:MAG: sigma-70 family RNA polymerase sigma factor [Nocardioidaceae bacterium]|nr:sigma-70 family RNA polymerase sigma factor [Nocardioidaceae bacterium]
MSTEGLPRRWDDVSDDALVRAARLDDQDAFAEIVDRYGSGMLGYARRLVGDHADAADVVQAAFVSAWRGLPTFEGRSALRTWLFRLVQRRAADLARARRPTPVDDRLLSAISPADRRDPLQGLLDSELVAALQAALAELPWHQRSVWLLREFEGMTYDEIADVLAITPGSVRMHLHRGRRTLAERMARWR